jgi:hypothetical protein
MRKTRLYWFSIAVLLAALAAVVTSPGNAQTQPPYCSGCNCLMIHAYVSINNNQSINPETLYSGSSFWTLANGQYSPSTNASGLNCSKINDPAPQPGWTIYTPNCPPNTTCVLETSEQIRKVERNMKIKCVLLCCPTNSSGTQIFIESIDDLTAPTTSMSWSRSICRVDPTGPTGLDP